MSEATQQTTEPATRAMRALPLVLLLPPVVDFLRLAWPRPPQIDDAFISYRYAANWVAGHGLVWNVGELVEGFTNPLWTFLIAGGLWLGADAEVLGHALGVACGLAILAATFWLARSWLPADEEWLAALATWPVAAFGGLAYWSTAGLETSLFVALALFALLAANRGSRTWLTVTLVLLTLTRMDGVLIAGVLLGYHALDRRREGIAALAPALAYGACTVIALGIRLAYYGTLVPNTYWAKVGGIPLEYGALYLWEFLSTGAIFLLPAAALGLWRARETRPAGAAAGLVAAYVVYVGGDAFPFSRFLLVALPPLSAIAVVGMAEALKGALAPRVILATCLALACVSPVLGGVPTALADFSPPDRERRLDAQWKHSRYMQGLQRKRVELIRQGPTPRLVAAGAIGSLGYYSGQLTVLDILGLTDAHIARRPAERTPDGLAIPGHARSDADYVFAQVPELIIIPQRDQGPVWMYALRDLWAHPELERSYRWDPELQAYRRISSASSDSSAEDVRGR